MKDFSGRPFKSTDVLVLETENSSLVEVVINALMSEAQAKVPLMIVNDTAHEFEKVDSFTQLKLSKDHALACITFENPEGETNYGVFLGTKAELNTLFLEDKNIKYEYLTEDKTTEFVQRCIPLLKKADAIKMGETLQKRDDTETHMAVASNTPDGKIKKHATTSTNGSGPSNKERAQSMLRKLILGLQSYAHGYHPDNIFKTVKLDSMKPETVYLLSNKGEEPHTMGFAIDGKLKVLSGNEGLEGITDLSLFELQECQVPNLNELILDTNEDKELDVLPEHNGINNILNHYLVDSLEAYCFEENTTLKVSNKLLDDLADGKLDSLIQKHKLMREQNNGSKH